ncbi:MAG: hypothetical protein NVS1B14_03030 [Vulcanimicrobiaceae bacterium]
MAAGKVILFYPHPTENAAFEKAYSGEHLPMAGPRVGKSGASKITLTKLAGVGGAKPAFHRMVEIFYPSLEKMHAALTSTEIQEAVGHATKISSGGAPVIMVTEEEQTITF